MPAGVIIRYLVGQMWVCLREFERREKETGRGLTVCHWIDHNTSMVTALEDGQITPEWCVEAFDAEGKRRSFAEIVVDLHI